MTFWHQAYREFRVLSDVISTLCQHTEANIHVYAINVLLYFPTCFLIPHKKHKDSKKTGSLNRTFNESASTSVMTWYQDDVGSILLRSYGLRSKLCHGVKHQWPEEHVFCAPGLDI